MSPLSTENEEKIILALIAELNSTFGLRLDTHPDFERGGASPVDNTVPD
jgi:hypothetical protein